MRILPLHSWHASPQKAVSLQNRLRHRLVLRNGFKDIRDIRYIAGCDIAIDPARQRAYGGVIVYRFPELSEVERRGAESSLSFPYVPGLLTFREAPVLLKVFRKLRHEPDLVIFDGQGIAHPRGIGLAAHLGLFLDRPTVGCAKSRLFGEYEEPDRGKGSWSMLRSPGGDTIGLVLRSRDDTRPVFISPGHRVDLATARRVILSCLDGYRIPKPTREADHYVESLKRHALAASSVS